ncbi:MAG TPA: lytic murein transglycosylase [Roseiarcus sp.]|nr:lytic murein transglycosylase [Roseiarcus sp.]
MIELVKTSTPSLASARLLLVILAVSLALPGAARADFASCLAAIRSEAVHSGIPGSVFDQATAGVQPDMKILDLQKNQPEFKTPIWDYLAGLVDDERIADGKEGLRKYARAFALAEERYGVPRTIIAAVWGVESNFGKTMGSRPLIQSLATLGCYGERAGYFRGELIATLKIVAHGDIAADRLVGSWAGAFGQTQFMPSTFLRLAVDLDGDGRRDIVDSVPDAIGSTANFLHHAGWRSGIGWGFEVKLPEGYSGPSGRRRKAPMSAWAARGIRRVDGRPLGEGEAGLLLPAGPNGPAFLVTSNFDAIYSYNAAESYALAIAHLSDRLAGGGPFVTPWPTDDPGLSRAERRELQRLLTQRGYDVGEPDGAIGNKTREAIADFQRKIGRSPDGRPSAKVLAALRQGM